jgi:hypothetical protein
MAQAVTLEDFNNNFTVRIAEFTQDNATSIGTVYYEVKCMLNNRLSIHIANVDLTQMQEGYTANDVIEAGWNNVKSNVNSWATTNIANQPITTYTPTSTNADITLTDFNNAFTVYLQRWELFPSVEPNSWCVGFVVVSKTRANVSFYRDCNLNLHDFCNNTHCMDIMNAAWDIVKDPMCSLAATEIVKSTVLNNLYTPSDITP